MKIDPRTTLDRARERRNGVRSAGQIERRIDRLERSDPAVSGMVEDVDAITNLQYARFSTTPGEPSAGWVTGNLYWDSSWGVLSAQLTNDVTSHMSMNLFMPPTNNNSGVQIDRGDFVMATGVQGDRITIAKAVTDGTIAPDYMIGVAAHDIPDGATDGKIMTHGEVWQIDTSLWPIGTILYPDPATPGGLTSTKPSAPDIRTAIAFVLRQHVNTGRIMVRMTTGSVLGGSDQNVNFGTLADGDVVTWDATAGYWTNAPAAGGGGIGTLTPNGIVVQDTSTPTYVSRSVAGTTNQITISNGDGVGGDPTVAIARDVQLTGNVTTTYDATTTRPVIRVNTDNSLLTGALGQFAIYRGSNLAADFRVDAGGTVDFRSYSAAGSNPDFRIFAHQHVKIIPANEAAGEAFRFQVDTSSTGTYGYLTCYQAKSGNTSGARIQQTGGPGLAIEADTGFVKIGAASAVPVTISQAGQTTTVGGALAVNGNTTLGDTSGDTVTVNAGTVTMPANSLNVTAINDATVQALASYNTNGLLTQTAADTFTGRTVTGTTNQIDVTNGSGVAGNPTLALSSTLVAPGSLDVTGNLTKSNMEVGYVAGSFSTSVSVNLTTTQTTVLTSSAVTLVAGDVIKASVFGNFGVTTTATPTLTIRLRQGTTVVVDVPVATTASQVLANNWFWFEAEVTIVSTTSAAGIGAIRAVHDGNTSPNVSIHRLKIDNATTIASGSNTWNISLQWSGTTGNATCYGGYIKIN